MVKAAGVLRLTIYRRMMIERVGFLEIATYRIRPGEFPNPVREAAVAYLEAAETIYKAESEKHGFWFGWPNWYVVHHLSFIATELFLKSFYAKCSHSLEGDDSGPDWEKYDAAYRGHDAQLKVIATDIWREVERRLSERQLELIELISTNKDANTELSRGRYPYEVNGSGDSFPSGEDGRQLSEDWLNLARTLAKVGFGDSV